MAKENRKMNAVPDLTPPGKSEKPKKEPKVKAVKEPKPVNTDGTSVELPKKERAPRSDYGYKPDAVISINANKDVSKIRGNVKAWYDRVKEFEGKTVASFIEANKGNEKDPPRGWIRHFAQNDYISLKSAEVQEQPAETPPAA
jgi:GH25 family lysozyme M1 (1,4-beta-N-acetylmuramidase)